MLFFCLPFFFFFFLAFAQVVTPFIYKPETLNQMTSQRDSEFVLYHIL